MSSLGLIFLMSMLPIQNAQPRQYSGKDWTVRMDQAHQALPGQPAQGRICYAIRSYLFKRDDDRAPVLVSTTTCTQVLPQMKNATAPKARVVPAVIH